jgi:deoxyuridine 5'-triphosphate nucleotidohydrolase
MENLSPLRYAQLAAESNPAAAPLRASASAAGYDLRAAHDCTLPPGGTATLVRTGIAVALPPSSVGIIKSRSSLAARHNVEVGAGVIDADYRGEIGVLLRNFGTDYFDVRAGDRIAQLVVLPLHPLGAPQEHTLADLGDTERGTGGFGSTGRS